MISQPWPAPRVPPCQTFGWPTPRLLTHRSCKMINCVALNCYICGDSFCSHRNRIHFSPTLPAFCSFFKKFLSIWLSQVLMVAWKVKVLVAQSCPTLQPHGLSPASLLCPCKNTGILPGQNTGMVCHSLIQGIFPPQGLNPGLLHCRQILYHWATSMGDTYLQHVESSSLSGAWTLLWECRVLATGLPGKSHFFL